MTYKFQLNADLKEVWSRLAGDFKADVASTGKAADSYPAVGSSSLPIGSTLLQEDNDANTD